MFARRKDTDWYVAGINGLAGHRQSYALKLDFVSRSRYNAFICPDDMEHGSHAIRAATAVVSRDETVEIDMMPSGGFLMRLTER